MPRKRGAHINVNEDVVYTPRGREPYVDPRLGNAQGAPAWAPTAPTGRGSPAVQEHRALSTAGRSQSSTTSADEIPYNTIIQGAREVISRNFGFITNRQGRRVALTTPKAIHSQFQQYKDQFCTNDVAGISQRHILDILIARKQCLLKDLGRKRQAAGEPASSTSSSEQGLPSLLKRPGRSTVTDAQWIEWYGNVRGAYVSLMAKHAQRHFRCTLAGDWYTPSCPAWEAIAQKIKERFTQQAERTFVAEQDIQRARGVIFAIDKNAGMIPFVEGFNQKYRSYGFKLAKEEIEGWKMEIENTVAIAHAKGQSVGKALQALQARDCWKQLNEHEKSYLSCFFEHFRMHPGDCRIFDYPADMAASSGSSSSRREGSHGEGGTDETLKEMLQGKLAAEAVKERAKMQKMRQWVDTTSEEAEGQPKISLNAIQATMKHMDSWERRRKNFVPPKAEPDDVGTLNASTSQSSQGSRASSRGRYSQLASVVLDESNSRPGGRSLVSSLASSSMSEYDDDGESYSSMLQRAGVRMPSGSSNSSMPENRYLQMSDDVSSGSTGFGGQPGGKAIPTGRARNYGR